MSNVECQDCKAVENGTHHEEYCRKHSVYCHGCSEAAGGMDNIYHEPPMCKSSDPVADAKFLAKAIAEGLEIS